MHEYERELWKKRGEALEQNNWVEFLDYDIALRDYEQESRYRNRYWTLDWFAQ